MIDYDALISSFVPLFRPVLANGEDSYPLIVIPSNVESPVPAYASIQLIDATDIGQLDEGLIYDEGQDVKIDIDMTIRIQTYGKGAFSRASKLNTTLQFPSMTEKLDLLGVAWRNSTPVRNISSKVTSSFEDRAVFDVTLGVAFSNREELDNPDGNPQFDPDIVPIQKVTVEVYKDDSPETQGDEELISSVTVTT